MRSADQPRTPLARLLVAPFAEFARTGALGGVALIIVTVIALSWANSPWADSYHHLWEMQLSLGPSGRPLMMSLHHWINDALMVVFFLVVGLEIKRELLVGELASLRQATLPIAAALGGMIVPALIYTAFNATGPGAPGWGVPMATDIAFALGALALLGDRVPIGLRVFLAALAIVDDLGAVLVIALFYTSDLNLGALAMAGGAMAVLITFNRLRIMQLWPYLLVGVALWYFVLQSGVHATIAGVLLALAIPSFAAISAPQFSERGHELLQHFDRANNPDGRVISSKEQQEALFALDMAASQANAPLLRLEHMLNPFVQYGIMPVFALANAGVQFGSFGAALRTPVAIGVILGLVLGKFVGISSFSWLSVRLGLAALPTSVSWRQLRGAAMLGGIGFTMSLFIAGLAFNSPELNDDAKIGILVASTLSGVLGFLYLKRGAGGTPIAGDGSGG